MSLHSPSRNSNSKKEKEEQLISFQTLITSQTNSKLNDAEKELNHSSFSNRQELINVNSNSTDQSNTTREKGNKNALFSTSTNNNTNQSSKSTESSLNVKDSNSLNSIKDSPHDNSAMNQFSKDSYLDLLINSADALISSKKVSIEYLNSCDIQNDSVSKNKACDILPNQIEPSFFSKKCENKSCSIIVDKPSDIFQAKILSQKSKSLWLCSKCYNAWKMGQYCYYCNIIYRDFSFNQQYYDSKTWIECDYCQKWTHLECEEKKGKQSNIKKLIKNENFKYMCPCCVIEKEKSKKIEEETQMLKKKRFGFQYDAFSDDNKNKKKNPNDIRRFLQCDESIEMINDLELIMSFSEKK